MNDTSESSRNVFIYSVLIKLTRRFTREAGLKTNIYRPLVSGVVNTVTKDYIRFFMKG